MANSAEKSHSLLGPAITFRDQVRYTGAIAERGFRLNQMICSWTQRENRERFTADPEAYMQTYALSDEERQFIRAKDCMGLFRYGVNIYAVAKAGTVLGVPLPVIGAAMRASAEKERE